MKNKYILVLVIAISTLLSSCREDDLAVSSPSLSFRALIADDEAMGTRAPEFRNITAINYGSTPFYIRMETGNEILSGVYKASSLYEGRLDLADDSKPLSWRNLDSDHVFYGWTYPGKNDPIFEEGGNSSSEISFVPEDYGDNFQEYMERFIGVKEGPVNYRSNGEYVELQFLHLVSKIVLKQITLIKENGSTENDVRGTMKIIGLPRIGVFERRPEDGMAPPQILPLEGSLKDVSFQFSNATSSRDFYIIPGLDIPSLSFEITLTTPNNIPEIFYGDFSSVRFKRPLDDDFHAGKLSNILYSGEIMSISVTLSQGKVTNVNVSIRDWSNQEKGTSITHSRNGIYKSEDLNEVLTGSYTHEELKDLYGEEDDDRIIFRQYEDLDYSNSSQLIFDDSTLDGMGHTINMKSTGGGVTLKNVRDVYITDGNNTIYIDSEGKIWTVDAQTGKLTDTGNKLEEDKTFRVNLETGIPREN